MKRIAICILTLTISICIQAQGYTNPVIPGFNPDPSVCRAGDDYYVVTSSFHYFPGVPIYHSKDLVNWEQVGHVLSRKSQLELPDARSWSGIYAPTIRHHNGRFYMITTNCSSKGNFIVTTDDPRGEWSDPIWVDLPGIDPDLFWDEDGTCWYSGAGNDGIVQCQINPDTGEKLSEPRMIWYGTGGRYPEAPHIYKKDGWYYLLIAEGGTEFGHGVTIARSRHVDGPYIGAPHNPILTHFKQATQKSQIQGVGHADIVQAHDGSWWMVCLGFRTQSGSHHLMGRETFLAPVSWEKGAWPVVNGTGDIALEMNVPTLPQKPFAPKDARNEFTRPQSDLLPESALMKQTGLGPQWWWIRNPEPSRYVLNAGFLRLYGTEHDLQESTESPTFAGFRQQDIDFTAETCMWLGRSSEGDRAGMTVFMDAEAHYDIYLRNKGNGKWTIGIHYAMGVLNHIEETEVENAAASKSDLRNGSPRIWLRITGESDYYRLWYSLDGHEFIQAGINHTRYLSSETVSGFTGILIGLWAQSPSGKGYADFDYFEYR